MIRRAGRYVAIGGAAAIVGAVLLVRMAVGAWRERRDGSPRETSKPNVGPVLCRACGKPLLPANVWMADGCPCNSARGINHGLVSNATCMCALCDPAQTGAVRRTAN